MLSFLVTHLLFSSDFTITRQCIFILKNFHLQFHSQKQSNHLKSKTSAVEICKALPSTKCWFLLWILTYYNLFQKQLKTPGWASAIYTDTYRWLAVNGFFWWKDLRWLQYVASLWNHKTLHSHAICCVKVNFIWCLTIFFPKRAYFSVQEDGNSGYNRLENFRSIEERSVWGGTGSC